MSWVRVRVRVGARVRVRVRVGARAGVRVRVSATKQRRWWRQRRHGWIKR